MRWEEWGRLREVAIANHQGDPSTLPASLKEPMPSRPPPFEDEDMGDVSADILNQSAQLDGNESFSMDKAMQEDHVPVADPGLEKAPVGGAGFSMNSHAGS